MSGLGRVLRTGVIAARTALQEGVRPWLSRARVTNRVDYTNGKLIGYDKLGNRYFENKHEYHSMQSRWVVPADPKNYDASQYSSGLVSVAVQYN